MKPYEEVSNKVAKDLERFEKEVKEVYTQIVLPTWTGELHGLTGALYGYLMGSGGRC